MEESKKNGYSQKCLFACGFIVIFLNTILMNDFTRFVTLFFDNVHKYFFENGLKDQHPEIFAGEFL